MKQPIQNIQSLLLVFGAITLVLGFYLIAQDSPDEQESWSDEEMKAFADQVLYGALWNEYQKVRLEVFANVVAEPDRIFNFKEQAAETLFESRLRAARLFREPTNYEEDLLSVSVDGVGNAFTFRLSYKRWLDIGYGQKRYATIWSRGNVGTHGYDESYIKSSLSEELTSSFLNKVWCN